MATLPQLLEEDVQQLEKELSQLLVQTEATSALVIDQGGFLIASQGEAQQFDLTTIAALAAGTYLANQTIAGLVNEPNFNSVYQQGQNFSMLVVAMDENCLLVVIFQAQVTVGLVKYYARPAIEHMVAQLQIARNRNPDAGFDLSELNLPDPSGLFRRKVAGEEP